MRILLIFLVLDQFLHSNLNTRDDEYGGSAEARCKFPLDVFEAVSKVIGASNVAIRLEPTGLYQGTFGSERVETWSHLCEQLAASYTGDNKLSYVHFIEPRFDRIKDNEKIFSSSWSLPEVSNEPFRKIIAAAGIPCLSCGGWGADNATEAVEAGKWDAAVIAKWFASNPDLPERLKLGKDLQAYDRSRFYGSWDGIRENGYTNYKTWEEQEADKP